MLFESDAAMNRTLLRSPRWMLFDRIGCCKEPDVTKVAAVDALRIGCFQEPDLPHKRYYGSGMDALVTVCSSVLTRVSGEGDDP